MVIRMTCTIHVNGHVLTILPPFLAAVVRRLPLPRDWSTMLVFPGYAIDQSSIDVEEVDPIFVMATLICVLETQHAVRDSEGSETGAGSSPKQHPPRKVKNASSEQTNRSTTPGIAPKPTSTVLCVLSLFASICVGEDQSSD